MQAEINQLRAHISGESIRRIERSLDVALSHVEVVRKEKDTELAHCKVIIDTANANLNALQQKYDEEIQKNKATEERWSKKYSADLGALQQKCNEEIEKHAATEERWIKKYNADLGALRQECNEKIKKYATTKEEASNADLADISAAQLYSKGLEYDDNNATIMALREFVNAWKKKKDDKIFITIQKSIQKIIDLDIKVIDNLKPADMEKSYKELLNLPENWKNADVTKVTFPIKEFLNSYQIPNKEDVIAKIHKITQNLIKLRRQKIMK